MTIFKLAAHCTYLNVVKAKANQTIQRNANIFVPPVPVSLSGADAPGQLLLDSLIYRSMCSCKTVYALFTMFLRRPARDLVGPICSTVDRKNCLLWAPRDDRRQLNPNTH